jgi:hypothetical protein
MSTKGPRIIEWYRADPWPRMRRVLLTGPALLTAGGLIVFLSLITHQSMHVRIAAAVAGFALIAGGALLTMVGMHRILRDEVCLALRTDGVMVQSSGRESLIGWDELDGVRWDQARSELVLQRGGGAPPITVEGTFARIDGPTLVRRIEATKRKAALNLLR